jgi:hypothetical protein
MPRFRDDRSAQEPPQETYIAAGGRLHYAGGGRLWIVDPIRDRVLEAPEEAGPILQLADRFRTLAGHRRALLEAGWQDDGSGSIDALLAGLVRSGALRSRGEVLGRILEAQPEAPPPPVDAICWITRDRPQLLRRSLESAIANLRRFGRRAELRVYDDSAQVRARQDTRDMLAELGRREGFPVFYAGAEEKRAFAAALQAGVGGTAPETIEFALFDPFGIGYTPGANTNAAMLDTLGRCFLRADDDSVFRFAAPPGASAGLRLSSEADPTERRFFAGREEREKAVTLRDVDILAAHEALLGRPVADCLRRFGGQADCDQASPEFLTVLETSRIAVTMAGVCGDSGMGSALSVLWLEGEARARAMASNDSYRVATSSREILRGPAQSTISQGTFLMYMNCGLDNRLTLPPFLPALRNADGLFGQVLRAVLPRCLIAHLPEAALHLPEEKRIFEGGLRVQPRLSDLLLLLVRSLAAAPWSADPELGHQIVGTGLIEAARLSPLQFQGLLRQLWVAEMSRYAAVLEQLLERHHGEPGYWAADAKAWHEQTRRRLTEAQPLVPADLAGGSSGLDGAALAQRIAGGFGELLRAWPGLREQAGRLAAAGLSLAQARTNLPSQEPM